MTRAGARCARGRPRAGARRCQYRLLPLMDANFLETNPSPVKAGAGADGQDPRRAPAAAGAGGSRHARRAQDRARGGGRPCPLKRRERSGRSRAVHRRRVARGEEPAARVAFIALKAALNAGKVRAAERGADGVWRANAWVKAGILLGFRLGSIEPAAPAGPFPFYDKDTYPLRRVALGRRRPHRARRLGHPRRLLRGAGRGLHAADVHQRRRLGRTRARWWTRTRWSARAPRSADGSTSPRRPRSAACSSRRARCR